MRISFAVLLNLLIAVSMGKQVYKVLMTNLAAGSHLKNEWELAHSLSMKPDFDVTVITSRDFKLEFEEADSLHFIRLESIKESDCNDLFQETGDPLAWTVQWTRLLTKEILYNEEIMT